MWRYRWRLLRTARHHYRENKATKAAASIPSSPHPYPLQPDYPCGTWLQGTAPRFLRFGGQWHTTLPRKVSSLRLRQPEHREDAHLQREHKTFSSNPQRFEKPEQ